MAERPSVMHEFVQTGTETSHGYTRIVGCCTCEREWPCPTVLARVAEADAAHNDPEVGRG